jgi:hypothetical protein
VETAMLELAELATRKGKKLIVSTDGSPSPGLSLREVSPRRSRSIARSTTLA